MTSHTVGRALPTWGKPQQALVWRLSFAGAEAFASAPSCGPPWGPFDDSNRGLNLLRPFGVARITLIRSDFRV